MRKREISPSILSADFSNFQSEIKKIEDAGVDYAHIDIMDGHFVPSISFGANLVANLRSYSKLIFDCHLMVSNPHRHLDDFVRAGADIISVHVEATDHIYNILEKVRSLGAKPSVVINPGTPVSAIENVLVLVDQVLVMTVNPGFSGQVLLPETLRKVEDLVKLRKEKGLDFDIEVDGGIDNKTIAQVKQAGANIFVSGSYIFQGRSDVSYQIKTLQDVLND